MAYKGKKRMRADQKEGQNASKIDNTQWDTELASDTWMGAVFNPEASKSNGKETKTYDPYTQTERYRGEGSVDGDPAVGPLNGDNAHMSAKAGETDTDDRPTVKRMIVDDSVADLDRGTRYEVASEVAPTLPRTTSRSPESDTTAENNPGGGLGMTALGLSILSLFLFPYVLAPIGMVIGFLAYRRGARTMGIWSMVIGAVAILGALVIYPYFVAR